MGLKATKKQGFIYPRAAHGPFGHVCTACQKESIHHTPPRQLSLSTTTLTTHDTTATHDAAAANDTAAAHDSAVTIDATS